MVCNINGINGVSTNDIDNVIIIIDKQKWEIIIIIDKQMILLLEWRSRSIQ